MKFSGLALRNPAPARWTTINDTYIVNTALAALPSIDTEPNATVSDLPVLTCQRTAVAKLLSRDAFSAKAKSV